MYRIPHSLLGVERPGSVASDATSLAMGNYLAMIFAMRVCHPHAHPAAICRRVGNPITGLAEGFRVFQAWVYPSSPAFKEYR